MTNSYPSRELWWPSTEPTSEKSLPDVSSLPPPLFCSFDFEKEREEKKKIRKEENGEKRKK
jgi:hypothetical protein